MQINARAASLLGKWPPKSAKWPDASRNCFLRPGMINAAINSHGRSVVHSAITVDYLGPQVHCVQLESVGMVSVWNVVSWDVKSLWSVRCLL